MKVILNQTVPKVGKEGQVVNVAPGFARNYLFPRGYAIFADRAQIKVLEKKNERMVAKLEETKQSAVALLEKLEGKTVRIEGKVGKDSGKLFGAVTAQDVADAIQAQLGQALDKRVVGVLEPIKRLGMHRVEIDLHRDVTAHVSVLVFDPEHPELTADLEETEAVVAEPEEVEEEA